MQKTAKQLKVTHLLVAFFFRACHQLVDLRADVRCTYYIQCTLICKNDTRQFNMRYYMKTNCIQCKLLVGRECVVFVLNLQDIFCKMICSSSYTQW